MTNNLYNAIRKWAPKNVDAKLAKTIRKDIDRAWANNNSKAKKRFEFLYKLGEHANLPNAVQSIDIEERTKTSELQSCWMCGTRHADTYKASCNGSKDHYIGKDCGQILAKYGLGTGIIIQADKKEAERKRKEISEGLDSLVLSEGGPIQIFSANGPVKSARSDFLGSNLSWLLSQDIPDNVRQAAEDVKDAYTKSGRTELKTVLNYISANRKFPGDAYKPVLQDVKAMEAEGKMSGVAAKLEAKMKTGTMTHAEAKKILNDIDIRSYRAETNTKLLRSYNEPLGTILNEIMPALVHDKDKWHKDYASQVYVQDKVLSQTDYRLARGCVKRWMFGATDSIEGADKNRIRNFAINLESVVDFEAKVEGLVVIQRKLQYAKDQTSEEEYAQISAIRESVEKLPKSKRAKVFEDARKKAYETLQEPMRLLQAPTMTIEAFQDEHGVDISRVASILPNVQAKGWLNDFKRKYLGHIAEHLQYGIIRKEDAPRLAKASELLKEYVRV